MYQSVICRCILFVLTFTSCQAADCPGIDGHLDSENIVNFAGCSKVMGNIVLNQVSFQSNPGSVDRLTVDQLSVLSGIVEVDGYVQVENTDYEELTNLRFLRNLETINGHETLEVFPNQHYSLVVSANNYLQTLNLASLKKIENGGVRIISNPQLCLVDTISVEDYLVGSMLSRIGDYAQDCSGVSCHEQCEMSRGCWGTLADECVQCRSYNYQGTCVESCDESISYADDETMSCIPLPTMSMVSSGSSNTTTPVPSPTHYSNSNNSMTTGGHKDDENHTQENATVTPITNSNDALAPWVTAIIGIAVLILGITFVAAVIGVVYGVKKRIAKKSVTRKPSNKVPIVTRETKVIHVVKDGTASQAGSHLLLTRKRHTCSSVSTDTTYDCVQDTASAEPEVVVMVDTDTSLEQDHYTRMPYEQQTHDEHNTTQQSQGHMTQSCDIHIIHMTDSVESPVYDTIESQPCYESAEGDERVQTQSTSPKHAPNNTVMKSQSRLQLQNSRSSFQHSLPEGTVYSTRTTTPFHSTSHTHHSYPSSRSSLSQRSSLTSPSNQSTTSKGQRAIGRTSRLSNRLSTAGGSIVSSSGTGTSTRESVNSIVTMNELNFKLQHNNYYD